MDLDRFAPPDSFSPPTDACFPDVLRRLAELAGCRVDACGGCGGLGADDEDGLRCARCAGTGEAVNDRDLQEAAVTVIECPACVRVELREDGAGLCESCARAVAEFRSEAATEIAWQRERAQALMEREVVP